MKYTNYFLSTSSEIVDFPSQINAAKSLNVSSPNISHVLAGRLSQTGGFEFKKETIKETVDKVSEKKWSDICDLKGYGNASKGKLSPNRVEHEEIDGILGKKCCSCQQWQRLDNYNHSKNHWDELRNDCKDCLTLYRENTKRTNDRIQQKVLD